MGSAVLRKGGRWVILTMVPTDIDWLTGEVRYIDKSRVDAITGLNPRRVCLPIWHSYDCHLAAVM